MKKFISSIVFGLMFAGCLAFSDILWAKYAPIENFIEIKEFKLLDSKIPKTQVGYSIRNNNKAYLADFRYKYACKNESGVYTSSTDTQFVHEGIHLNSTKGKTERIDFEFEIPKSIRGECRARTSVFISIRGNERYYGDFTNFFFIK